MAAAITSHRIIPSDTHYEMRIQFSFPLLLSEEEGKAPSHKHIPSKSCTRVLREGSQQPFVVTASICRWNSQPFPYIIFCFFPNLKIATTCFCSKTYHKSQNMGLGELLSPHLRRSIFKFLPSQPLHSLMMPFRTV